jgi:hypothetical protein
MGTANTVFKALVATGMVAALGVFAPADAQSPGPGASGGPAVSGFNTKFSGEGGLYDDEDAGLFQGSVTTPLGYSYGFQADGIVGGIDGETIGGGAIHLFTRDPSSYLVGIYGSYHSWDSIDITRLAAEGELYMGRMMVSGLAGWEDVDVPGTRNGLIVTTRDDEHFFTELDVSYYPVDNMRLAIGYHYESEESLGVAQFEYMPGWGMPGTLFATGYFGEEDHSRITGGLRFYFGPEPNKSLIRRHREDDPKTYNPVFPQIMTTAPGGGPNFCPTPGGFPKSFLPCICPDGTDRAGQPPKDFGEVASCDNV